MSEYVTETEAREWGATHYGYDEDVDLYVLLAPYEHEEGAECEAAEEATPCTDPWWQPINQEGGPGAECQGHTMLSDIRPIDGPVRMYG